MSYPHIHRYFLVVVSSFYKSRKHTVLHPGCTIFFPLDMPQERAMICGCGCCLSVFRTRLVCTGVKLPRPSSILLISALGPTRHSPFQASTAPPDRDSPPTPALPAGLYFSRMLEASKAPAHPIACHSLLLSAERC